MTKEQIDTIEKIYKDLAKKYQNDRGWSIGIDSPYFKEVILPMYEKLMQEPIQEKTNSL